MAFITQADLEPYIEADDLTTISQGQDGNIDKVIQATLEDMAGYLRGRYNIADAFSEDGDTRDQALLQKAIDLTLFHLHKALPSNMVPEKRLFFYQEAMVWLKDVQKGVVTLNLQLAIDGDTGEPVSPLSWGSNEKIQSHGY